MTRGLPPPDPRSLSSTEFVDPPPSPKKIPGYATGNQSRLFTPYRLKLVKVEMLRFNDFRHSALFPIKIYIYVRY
jgi:hypothetical protein